MKDISKLSWFMKHQPKTIDELIFKDIETKNLIAEWIKSKQIPGNILLYGAPGLGKTSTLSVIVRSIIDEKFIKQDCLQIDTRSVKEIDEKLMPFLERRSISGCQKFVILEELDKLSRQAIGSLKDKKLERFQLRNVFIGTTNYFYDIDEALAQRFTFKIQFDNLDKKQVIKRLGEILKEENADFEYIELEKFINENEIYGLREIINQLQISYSINNGKIELTKDYKFQSLEETITNLFLSIMDKFLRFDIRKKQIAMTTPMQSDIAKEYGELVNLIHNNYSINYSSIFSRLDKKCNFIPFKLIIGSYYDKLKYKKLIHLNIIGCLYELMEVGSKI